MKKKLLLFLVSIHSIAAFAQKFANASVEPFTKTNFITSVIDIDNDGDDDLFGWQNHILNSSFLYRNDGKNIFTDVTISKNFSKRNNGIAADLDKNGFSDIYWVSGDTLRYSFYNGSTFSTVPNSVGCGLQFLSTLFNTTTSNIKSTKFGDFDNDGINDLVAHIVNGNSSGIYGIKGIISSSGCNFSFGTKLQTLITFSNTNTTAIQFADIDNDSDFDLLTAQGTSAFQNYNYAVYLNSGNGTYTQLSNSGFDIGRLFSFGTLGDLNNDGKIDVVSGSGDCCVTGNPISIYLSSKNETKFNVNNSAIKRVNNPYYFQANLVDINLDKLQDIYWTFMASYYNIPTTQCFINAGNNVFNEYSTELNLNVGKPSVSTSNVDNKSTIIDINSDFKPDVVGSSYHPINGTTYTNYQRINTTTNNSIKLKLDACTGLREGWGARIKYLSDGTWTYQQHAGYSSSNYPFLYLGMGTATKIDSLIIEWVGGKTSYINNVSAGSYLSISETDKCPFSPCSNSNAIITPQSSTTFCEGKNVVLNATTGANYTYKWYNNGLVIENATLSSYTTSTNGNYTVTITDGACNASSQPTTVTVNPLPIAKITPQGKIPFCQGSSVDLIASGGTSYLWNNGSSSTSVIANKGDAYYVNVYNSFGCKSIAWLDVMVYPSPTATITPKTTTNIKENESVVLAATKGTGYSYEWYKDGFVILNAIDSNFTATAPGNYTVKITTSQSCDSTSAAVTVKRIYTIPTYLPTNGLVGWWPFNGNANDESGNENHGTVNGATLTSDRSGKQNSAYNFDGISNLIQCSKTGPTGNPTLTISFWIKSSQKSYGHLIGYGNNGLSGQDLRIFINGNCSNSIAFDTYGNQKAKSNTLSDSWENYSISYDGNIGDNTTSAKFYKNGVLMSSECFNVNNSETNISQLIPITFGRYHGTVQTGFYNGLLDDITIYNRILTQEEITALFLGEACTSPIATITPQSATSFCSGGSVNLNTGTEANYTYQWLNNNTPISAATTATYKATTSGKYSVIVKNTSGCVDTSSVVSVNVTPNPSSPILTGPSTLCYNSKAIFKASIAGGTWGVANDYLLISSPQGLFRNNKMPPSNLYKTGVNYTLKSKDQLCSITAQKSVWIRNVTATSITLTAAKQTLKVGEEVAATATTKITGNLLYWLSASTSVVGVTGTSSPYIAIVKGLRPATGANITFAVDDAAKGCRNAAFLPFTVTTAASLVDNESNTTTYTTDLNVYPNPSNGMVTIENIGEAKTISLIDVTGRVLKTTTVNADRMRLDYSTITKGNYFISIQGENLKEMKSIVIE